eukprot:TRINITY_DN14000_c0_g1_i5.p1 TRINITY_DN14000_c0_g1~~TRINITY_DN14000_c0_g1_i5.p1  ORF type:complete len:188 (-),score=5.24 TRINITY_DN14000_c0_g1_i5:202-765(-)
MLLQPKSVLFKPKRRNPSYCRNETFNVELLEDHLNQRLAERKHDKTEFISMISSPKDNTQGRMKQKYKEYISNKLRGSNQKLMTEVDKRNFYITMPKQVSHNSTQSNSLITCSFDIADPNLPTWQRIKQKYLESKKIHEQHHTRTASTRSENGFANESNALKKFFRFITKDMHESRIKSPMKDRTIS